jgi:hypothetical protein
MNRTLKTAAHTGDSDVTHQTIGTGKKPVVDLKIPNNGDDHHLPWAGVRRRSGGHAIRSASAQAGMTSIHNLRFKPASGITCQFLWQWRDDFDGE